MSIEAVKFPETSYQQCAVDGKHRGKDQQIDEVTWSVQSHKVAQNQSSGVQLPPPKSCGELKEGTFERLKAFITELSHQVKEVTSRLDETLSSVFRKSYGSTEEMLVTLGTLFASMKESQTKLQMEDIERVRLLEMDGMAKNDETRTASAEAVAKAEKSGLASRIFGWIGSVFAVVVGAVMCATGVGAVAGALMIAGGVIGMVSNALQECAKAGLISKEVMSALVPFMTALEVVVAVASAVVTFGGGAAGVVAKFASKLAPKVAQMAEKVSSVLKNVAEIGTRAASASSSLAQWVMKTSLPVSSLVVDGGNTVAQTVNGALNADSTMKQADLKEGQNLLQTFQQMQKHLTDGFRQMTELFQDVLGTLTKAEQEHENTQHKVLKHGNV